MRVALPTYSFPQGTPSEIIVSLVFTWIFLSDSQSQNRSALLHSGHVLSWHSVIRNDGVTQITRTHLFPEPESGEGKKKEAWAVRCSSQVSEGNAEGDIGKPRGRCFLPPELDVSIFGSCSQMIYFYWISILLMTIYWIVISLEMLGILILQFPSLKLSFLINKENHN